MTTLTTWEEAFHAFIAYIPFMVPVSHLKGAKPSDHVLYPPTNLAQGVEQWTLDCCSRLLRPVAKELGITPGTAGTPLPGFERDLTSSCPCAGIVA